MGVALLNHFQNINESDAPYGATLLFDYATASSESVLILNEGSISANKTMDIFPLSNIDFGIYKKYQYSYSMIQITYSAHGSVIYNGPTGSPGSCSADFMVSYIDSTGTLITKSHTLAFANRTGDKSNTPVENEKIPDQFIMGYGTGANFGYSPGITSTASYPTYIRFRGRVGKNSSSSKVYLDGYSIHVIAYGLNVIIDDPMEFFK